MTTQRSTRSTPRETGLETEATMVEQLRRQIAEMPTRGEVASPQLLAEFARAQKIYLDKKIEFERQRRATAAGCASSERRTETGTAPAARAAAPLVERTIETPLAQCSEQDGRAARRKKTVLTLALIVITIVVAVALISWLR